MKRRLFSILLVLCITLAMLPASAFAKSASYNGEIIIENLGWLFLNNDEVGYYIPGRNRKFSVKHPNSGPYLKVTKTGENEITITVFGNVTLQGKEAISSKDANAIKSIKNLIITGATAGENSLSLNTTTRGTAISVLGDLTVTGIALTVTAGNGHALRANNITVSDATLYATNNSADSAAIQATQGDGPLGNLTVSGTSAITVTNNNANGRAIHATIINGNEAPGQMDASQVTISSPAPHTHRFDGTWTADTTNHWKTCNDCGAIIEKAAHIGGTATCSAKKKCEVCGQSYGELNPSNHTALSDWKFDETGHWKTCSACSTDIEKAAHTYSEWQITQKATAAEAGVKCRECSVCHYKETAAIPPVPCTHEGSTSWEPANDGEHHVKKCTDCGAIIEKAAHTGGAATCSAKKQCEICNQSYGEFDPNNHTHLSDWTSNETGHWKTCNDCGTIIEKTAHSGGAATCTEAKKCEVCGQSYSAPDPNNHTHLSDWIFDETGHWKTCNDCGAIIEKTAHTGGAATCTAKKKCEICNQSYGELDTNIHTDLSDWKFDKTGHWKTCNDCGAIIEEAAHSGGAATCNAKKKCEVCGEPYGELDPSNHTTLSDWTSNETGHWKVCADCKAADIDKAIHAYSDWIIDKEPTVAEAGAKCRECSVCHYKETATIHPVPCTHEGSTSWEPAGDGVHHVKKCADCGAIIEKAAHSGGTTTCSAKKKCTICGELYGELDPSNHTALSGWIFDETGHWKTCSACNTDIEKATHTGGTATCSTKKVCTVCGEPYGELDPNNHTHLSGWASDETDHWKDCADCKAADINKASHTYGDWIIDKEATVTEAGLKHRTCSVCHYKEMATIPSVPCTHERSTPWEPAGDGVHHVKKCADCGAIIEEAAHSGGAATCTEAKKCEVCGQTYGELNPSNHTDLSDWASDEADHWKTCNDCNTDIEKTSHTGGTATCIAKKKCEICSQSYGELDPNNHTRLSDWASNETHHWKVCADCKAADIDKTAHTYGDWIIDKEPTATEAGLKHRTCSVCHYKETAAIPPVPCTHEGSTTWKPANDGEHHVKKCTDCGAELDTGEHNFAYCDNSDNSHTMTCDVCGEARIEPHDFSHKTVPADDGKHHGECICGAFGAVEGHTYQNGSCTACGAADPASAKPTPGGSGIIITPEAAGPVFLSGANQTVALGSAAAFRIDYNYAAFRSVAVDGVTLDPADYTTWEGSTWVKLTAACTKSLTPGTHTLSVYFDGATAATTFTVGGQPNPATGARDAVGIAAAAAVIALLGSAALLRKK